MTADLPTLLKTSSPSDADLSSAIMTISQIMSQNDFATLDAYFTDPASMSIEMMICLLRTTYPVRWSLPRWGDFLAQASAEVEKRGRDPQKLFRGLRKVSDHVSQM